MAIDRETIAETYYGGVVDGKPSGLMRSGIEGWTTAYDEWSQELKDEYSYNPERAKQLLAEAGYPNGFKTNIVAGLGDTDLLQVIQAYFKDINVDMEIKTMDLGAFFGYLRAGKHDQMYYWFEGGLGFAPTISIYWRASKGATSNFAYNNDAGYDALVQKFVSATTEEEARQIFGEASWYTLEHHWAVQIFPLAAFNIWQPYLKGYSGETLEFRYLPFYAARLWIDQDLKKAMGY